MAAAGHDTLRFRLAAQTSRPSVGSAASADVRVSTFVEAAWALVLSAFSGEEDVVFGSTRACRRSSIPGAATSSACSSTPCRCARALTADKPCWSFCASSARSSRRCAPFEHTPLVDVLRLRDVPRGTPLFDTIIVFNDAENDARLKAFGGAWHAREFELHDQTNFPMNVMAYDGPEIAFKLSYDAAAFERPTVERVASLLTSLLEAMATGPTPRLASCPACPSRTLRALPHSTHTARADPPPMCVHEAFEAQVDRTPDAVARRSSAAGR